MNKILLLFLLLTLHSCASVPLSTMVQMSSFDTQDFIKLNEDELRVKIMLPQGFKLNTDKSWLGIDIKSAAGKHQGIFELDQDYEKVISQSRGFLEESELVTEYTLQLSEASKVKFRNLQKFISRASAEDIHIRVVPKLKFIPEGAVSVQVWVDLLLSKAQGYFTLVNAAQLPLNKLRKK